MSITEEPEYFPMFKVREILNERSAKMISDMEFTSSQTAAGAHPFFDDDLPVVHAPFLPEMDTSTREYTLVLDLDETLVHYFDVSPVKLTLSAWSRLTLFDPARLLRILGRNGQILRTGDFHCRNARRKLHPSYLQYADSVLDQIDKHKVIKYRLYRQHTSPHGLLIAKDLSKIGRDLNKTILVDNVADNFVL